MYNYRKMKMSDIKKFLVNIIAVFWILLCSARGVVSAPQESLPMGMAQWTAATLLAMGVSGYVVTEILLNMKRRAAARVLKDEMTPEREKRERLLAVQKVFQWIALGGAALGTGVVGKKIYDEVSPTRTKWLEKQEEKRQAQKKAEEERQKLAEEQRLRNVERQQEFNVSYDDFLKLPQNETDEQKMSQLDWLTALVQFCQTLDQSSNKSPADEAWLLANKKKLVKFAASVKNQKVPKDAKDILRKLQLSLHPDQGGRTELFQLFDWLISDGPLLESVAQEWAAIV